MNYLVVEMQTNDGTTATLNYQYNDLALAKQKYYTVLAAAVVSSVECHAAVILDENGFLIQNESYKHVKPAPAPEPEPTPEPEPETT